MENDALKEKIKYYVEMLKIFWTFLLVLISGTITLLLNLKFALNLLEVTKISLIILGIFFTVVVILVIRDFNKQIFKLFDILEKK